MRYFVQIRNYGATYVYVMDRRQVEHSRAMGTCLTRAVKTFIGRTPQGIKLAVARADALAAKLNGESN